MCVKWPLPRDLNHSTTSLSRRKCTEVFPGGTTTRADFQKSAPRDSAMGASDRVLSSPRSRIASISLSEYFTVVDFLFIFTRSLGADDAYQVLTAPSEDHSVNLNADPAQSDPANFAVVFSIIDALQSFVREGRCCGHE